VRAASKTLKGDPTLLVSVLLSGVWVWTYSIVAHINDWSLPFTRYQLHPLFITGGFLFGLGASINQACSISTMNQLAKGHIGKLFTMIGWFLGWSIWSQVVRRDIISVQYQILDVLSFTDTLIISVSVTSILVICVLRFKPPIKLILGVSSIGFIASLLYYLVPNWTPSALMKDLGNATLYGEPVPQFLRMGIVVALLVGMWISVLINHNARLRFPRWRSSIRFLSAGTMMGVGAGMALGGNDTQLLFGIPATSPGALSALLFMFLGIACEQFFYRRGMMIYKKR